MQDTALISLRKLVWSYPLDTHLRSLPSLYSFLQKKPEKASHSLYGIHPGLCPRNVWHSHEHVHHQLDSGTQPA